MSNTPTPRDLVVGHATQVFRQKTVQEALNLVSIREVRKIVHTSETSPKEA